MATTDVAPHPLDAVRPRVFRHARCYAPEPVMNVLRDVAGAPQLALVLDIDALERSARARVDRVMLLALAALGRARVELVLAARTEHERALLLQRMLPGALWFSAGATLRSQLAEKLPGAPVIAITDAPELIHMLAPHDRGVALGRPELAHDNVVTIGDTGVRAMLWALLDERWQAIFS
jgi:hypothetical protein